MVARHVGLRRLLKLADHLDTVPPETFDMSTWWCGTKGCAMGHAAQMPAFRRLGLLVTSYTDFYEGVIVGVTFEGETDFNAAAAFFGLKWGEAVALFGVDFGDDPRTPAAVARENSAFVVREKRER